MGKYFVVFNDKYIVSVEASSDGAAEHRLLDLVPVQGLVECCQAYSIDTLQSGNLECLSDFIARARSCETLSYDEFTVKAQKYMILYSNAQSYVSAADNIQSQIDEMTSRIEDLKAAQRLNQEQAITCRRQMIDII